MKVKEESEKAGLKLNIQKTKMASGPFTLWQMLGKNHVAPPSSQDEALSRYSASGEVPR